MKANLLFFLFFLTTTKLLCQDTIIRTNGDTIPCKVSKIEESQVYFIIKRNHNRITTSIDRNEIRSLIIPVIKEDDPEIVQIKKRITNHKIWTCIGGTAFFVGGIIMTSGIWQVSQSGMEFYMESGNIGFFADADDKDAEQGMNKMTRALPFCVAGTIIGSINMGRWIEFNKKLNQSVKVSLQINYYPDYQGLTLSYRF